MLNQFAYEYDPRPDLWTVICDFDGTISDFDVTDALLDKFALPQWRLIEERWKAGKISARECMAQQVRLLRMTEDELTSFLATVKLDPDFQHFVMDCRLQAIPLQIVSDGLDVVIRRILSYHGLENIPIITNKLLVSGLQSYELGFPYAHPACSGGNGTCKCAIATRSKRRVLLIGDGASDFCLTRKADFVFAKNDLRRYCTQHNISHLGFSGFSEVRTLLRGLLNADYATHASASHWAMT